MTAASEMAAKTAPETKENFADLLNETLGDEGFDRPRLVMHGNHYGYAGKLGCHGRCLARFVAKGEGGRSRSRETADAIRNRMIEAWP